MAVSLPIQNHDGPALREDQAGLFNSQRQHRSYVKYKPLQATDCDTIADVRRLDGATILHHGDGRQNARLRKPGVLDPSVRLAQDLLEFEWNRFQVGSQGRVFLFWKSREDLIRIPREGRVFIIDRFRLPLIAVTGHSMDEDRRAAKAASIDCHFVKASPAEPLLRALVSHSVVVMQVDAAVPAFRDGHEKFDFDAG